MALTRLVAPEAFGVLTMATIFVGLGQLVNELGVGAALVQRQEVSEDHRTTALILAMGSGIVLLALTLLLSPLAAVYFHQPQVRSVLSVLATSFILGAVGAVPRGILQRALRFDRIIKAELAGEVAYALAGVALALAGWQVWALVGGSLARYASTSILLWLGAGWQPQGRWKWPVFQELSAFGARVLGTQVASYAASNLDYLIVGRVLGDASLGQYTLAFQLAMFPRMKISPAITRVAFPAFASVQGDFARLRRGYSRMINYISLITFPLVSGLLVLAPELVGVVFGPRWTPAIPSVQVLAIGGLVASVGTSAGSLLKGIGRPGLELRLGLASLLMLVGWLLAGVRFGIVGVSAAVSANTVLMSLPVALVVARQISLPLPAYFRALAPASLGSAAMVGGLLAYRGAAEIIPVSDGWLLGTAVLLGGVLYLIVLRLAYSSQLEELKGLLLAAVGQAPRASSP